MSAPRLDVERPPAPQVIALDRPAPPPPPPGRHRGTAVLGGVLVAAGVIWLAGALGLLDVGWRSIAAGALVVAGLAVVGLGATGHRAEVLVSLASVVLVVLAITATVPDALVTGGMGDRTERPTAMSEVAEGFTLGTGTLVVDLTDLPLPPGTTRVEMAVAAGELHVVVPGGVRIEVDASVDVGELDVLGEVRSGLDVDLRSASGGGSDRTLQLDLSVGVGDLEVRR